MTDHTPDIMIDNEFKFTLIQDESVEDLVWGGIEKMNILEAPRQIITIKEMIHNESHLSSLAT